MLSDSLLCFRIDYAICDKGFLSQVMEADIVKMVPKKWSDHAAVVVVLKEQPSLDPHPPPALSSRNMKRFHEDPRQKKLTSLFNKGAQSRVSPLKDGNTSEGGTVFQPFLTNLLKGQRAVILSS